MPPPPLVGQLALGIGLVFLRPLAAQLDHRAFDRIPLQPGERHARPVEPDRVVVEQQLGLARRVRLHRAFVRSFERELTC